MHVDSLSDAGDFQCDSLAIYVALGLGLISADVKKGSAGGCANCFGAKSSISDSKSPLLSFRGTWFRVKSTKSMTLLGTQPLVFLLLFFWFYAGIVAGVDPSGKLRFTGMFLVPTVWGCSLSNFSYHFEFPPGISEGPTLGVVT
jgi:hypothetical protein